MSARVNTKFVVILAVSLTLVGVLAIGLAYLQFTKSGDEYIALGDQAMEVGDYEQADEFYSKAVSHEPTRVDWIRKWRSALTKTVPETTVAYENRFLKHFMGTLERLASLQPYDPAAQRELLQARFEQIRTLQSGSASAWDAFASTVEEHVSRLDQSEPAARSLWRYRGLALLAKMRQSAAEQSVREQALEDLRTAVEADPTDADAARAIVVWHMLEWERLRNARREDEARRAWEDAQAALEQMRERLPDHPETHLIGLEMKIRRIDNEAADDRAKQAALRGLVGEEVETVEAHRSADVSTLDAGGLTRLRASLSLIGSPLRHEALLELVRRAREADPLDPRLALIEGEVLGSMGRSSEATEAVEAYLEAPQAPVSLIGLVQRYYRPVLYQRLAEYAVARWERAESPEQRAEALAEARERLDQLTDVSPTGAEDPSALLVRGKIALAERRYNEAARVLSELDAKRGANDPQAALLLGQALLGNGQLGAAREALERAVELDPTDLRSAMFLAEAYLRLRERERAEAVLDQAEEIFDDEAIARMRERVDAAFETDPEQERLRSVVSQARSLREQRTDDALDQARDLLRALFEENPGNLGVVLELVDVETARGELAEARRVVTEAQTHNPNNATLDRLERALEGSDPLAAAEWMIDNSDASEGQKLLRKYHLYRNQNRPERASELIAEALEAAPEDAQVIEAAFTDALREDAYERARELAGRAAELNIDQANGLTFQGRLELAQGRTREAVQTLRQARDMLPYASQVLLLLGQAQLDLGLVGEGLQTLAEAYEAKPDDALIARRYISALRDLQRTSRALEVARRAAELNRYDVYLRNIWLTLEAEAGDRELALRRRQEIRESDPFDTTNLLALANLRIDDGAFEEAESLIEQVRSSAGESLTLVRLRARILGERGDVEGGYALLRDYAERLERRERKLAAMMAGAQFLLDHGERDRGIEALREGRAFQDEGLMEADRQLADLLFQEQQFEEALEAYARIVDAGADTDGRVRRRLLETLLRLERYDEFDRRVAEMGADADTDVTVVMLRAEAATQRGERREAARLFDRAVELAPNDTMPLIRRARFSSQDQEQLGDATADLRQAIRLQPNALTPRRMLAEILVSRGRLSEAISELRRAVESNPDNDELRQDVIRLLLASNDYPAAIAFAEDSIEQRGDDPFWIRLAGDLNARAAEVSDDPYRAQAYWTRAAEHYTRIYDLEPSDDRLAMRLANALLLKEDPSPDRALEVIDSMTGEAREWGNIRMLRARALEEVGRTEDARAAAAESLASVRDKRQLRVWFDQLGQMLDSPLEVARFAAELAPPEDLKPQYEMLTAIRFYSDPNRQSEIMAILDRVEPQIEDPAYRNDLLRYRGRIEYQLGRFEQAAATFREAVELAPNDLEFNNNLAYLLSEHLGDVSGAVEPAERAAQLAPKNASVLDTLGWVYFRDGQVSQAQTALQNALQNATTPNELIPVHIHLSHTLLAKGDRAGARRLYLTARDHLLDAPGLNSLYGDKLEALREALDNAE